MPETRTPILVYDRIDANRRTARLLLTLFGVALLPIVSSGAAFIFPFIHVWYASWRPGDMADLTAFLWLSRAFFLVSMAIVALLLVAAIDRLISTYGSRIVLRLARARLVDSREESDLVHVVENLCIGAGLSPPCIHIIESPAPNAFATGRNPHDASLVVTRGLLELLSRRELESVMAHELCLIGNNDISLSTTLAALIGTMSVPFKIFTAPLRFAFRLPGGARICALLLVLFAFYRPDSLLMVWWTISLFISVPAELVLSPRHEWWWVAYGQVVLLYAVFVAPVLALLIRQAVWHQREFLADADAALLTRDPEGLALALVKVGAGADDRLSVGEGTAHLYFVDPVPKSWIHLVFPSHPSVEERVELLARMGNGIAPSAIQAAREAGARVQQAGSRPDEGHATAPDSRSDQRRSSTDAAERIGATDDGYKRLYDRPDSGSTVVALLPPDAAVRLESREGNFVRVATEGGVAGWVRRSAQIQAQDVAAEDETLAPLYEEPDGWSLVLAQLDESAVVTPIATEGQFIRVTTAEHQTGYVSRSARLTALKDFLQ